MDDLYCTLVQSPASGEPSSLIYTTASSDGGRTWPPARPFYSLSGAFTRNRMLPLAEPPGALLFPLYAPRHKEEERAEEQL